MKLFWKIWFGILGISILAQIGNFYNIPILNNFDLWVYSFTIVFTMLVMYITWPFWIWQFRLLGVVKPK